MPSLPKRTRDHVLETETEKFVQQFIPSEWIAEKEKHDYGIDLRVEIATPSSILRRGEEEAASQVTGAYFSIQLKGTDDLNLNKAKTLISHRCAVSALNYYLNRPEPVIYLVYDAKNKKAYWVFIQDYMRTRPDNTWKKQDTFTIHIPVANIFDSDSIEEIRSKALQRHEHLRWLSASLTAHNPHYRYDFHNSKEGISITVHPRYAGAEKDKPLVFKGLFKFDDSEKGKELFEKYRESIRTGEPFLIDAQFIEGFDITETLPDLFAHIDSFQIQSIEILPVVSEEKFAVTMVFLDEDKQPVATIPYVEFWKIKEGTEEITYSNERQQLPLRVMLRYNIIQKTLTIAIKAEFVGKNMSLIRDFLYLQQGVQRSCDVKLTNTLTGLSAYSRLSNEITSLVNPELVAFVEELAFVQEKLQQLIVWSGSITNRDIERSRQLKKALMTGVINEKRGSITLPMSARDARVWASQMSDINVPFQLLFEGDNLGLSVMSTELILGEFRAHLPNVRFSEDTLAVLSSISNTPDEVAVDITIEIADPGINYTLFRWITSVTSDSK